ncbi:Uncharacterized protein YjlB [Mesorhizobium albiziae]|uniref:Uncharacterized protein YjlB n=1 Tax=Neomesorhizobium albiziae TaxID=335020 RepID=A0A1I3VBS7_9HYPH|nr:hypothetical protein [Mesorhizobium albiziae]GLS28800.1 hypothetical protein GCM10007937_05070 [Mesorhizobium albiziae]SFJ92652.1 Uncharacterized protein YjlB [Mesorhizobium albiziae]
MGGDAILHVFQPNGGIPNSVLPLAFWKGRLPIQARSGEAATTLYRQNGWQGTWIYTVFPYWHFHTLGHEALACVSGSARIGFGGDDGIEADIAVGDVCIIPAGVGHKRLEASHDFLMAGGYPPGQQGNIVRPGDLDGARILREISNVTLPETDPVSGRQDGIVAIWRGVKAR